MIPRTAGKKIQENGQRIHGKREEKKMRISKEQIAMLQEAIPGLDIFNGENPTGGTWRQHPRYTIVKRMFRTGVWEPFPESVPDDQT